MTISLELGQVADVYARRALEQLSMQSVAAANGPFTPPLASALPGAPTDGQEIYYQNAAMAAVGAAWHLRYRAASASAYKWEFVGGSRLSFVSPSGQHDVTSTSFVSVPNNYNLTLPLAGDYEVQIDANGYCNAAGGIGVASYAVVGQAAANDVWGAVLGTSNGNGSSHSAAYAPINASSSGRVLNIQSRTSAGTTRIYWFRLFAVPIRVG